MWIIVGGSCQCTRAWVCACFQWSIPVLSVFCKKGKRTSLNASEGSSSDYSHAFNRTYVQGVYIFICLRLSIFNIHHFPIITINKMCNISFLHIYCSSSSQKNSYNSSPSQRNAIFLQTNNFIYPNVFVHTQTSVYMCANFWMQWRVFAAICFCFLLHCYFCLNNITVFNALNGICW